MYKVLRERTRELRTEYLFRILHLLRLKIGRHLVVWIVSSTSTVLHISALCRKNFRFVSRQKYLRAQFKAKNRFTTCRNLLWLSTINSRNIYIGKLILEILETNWHIFEYFFSIFQQNSTFNFNFLTFRTTSITSHPQVMKVIDWRNEWCCFVSALHWNQVIAIKWHMLICFICLCLIKIPFVLIRNLLSFCF